MKVRLKRVLALLLAAAMLASFCSVTVFAGEVAKGTNGKTIYLNWTYYSDKKVTNKVDSLEADTEYYARLASPETRSIRAHWLPFARFLCMAHLILRK